jgi:hypothetical protein
MQQFLYFQLAPQSTRKASSKAVQALEKTSCTNSSGNTCFGPVYTNNDFSVVQFSDIWQISKSFNIGLKLFAPTVLATRTSFTQGLFAQTGIFVSCRIYNRTKNWTNTFLVVGRVYEKSLLCKYLIRPVYTKNAFSIV